MNERPNQDDGGIPTGATRDVPGHTTFEYDEAAATPDAERCPCPLCGKDKMTFWRRLLGCPQCEAYPDLCSAHKVRWCKGIAIAVYVVVIGIVGLVGLVIVKGC